MISPQHLAKVRRYIELGPQEGATLLCGGLDAPELPAALAAATSSADGVCRRRQPHEDRAGRDLRPGGLPDPVRRRGRRGAHRQRHRATA
jgi:hypothetical protein